MTRDEKIKTLLDQIKDTDDFYQKGFKEGAKIVYDARIQDFENRVCRNCKYWMPHNDKNLFGSCDEINHTNIEIDHDFGCNKWESKD